MGKEEHAMRTERNANVLCMSGIVGEIAMHDAIGEMPSVYEGLLGTLDFTLKPRAISKNVYYPMSGKSLCMQNVELWKHQKGKALKSCISSPRRGRQDTVFICVAYLSTEVKWFLVFFLLKSSFVTSFLGLQNQVLNHLLHCTSVFRIDNPTVAPLMVSMPQGDQNSPQTWLCLDFF